MHHFAIEPEAGMKTFHVTNPEIVMAMDIVDIELNQATCSWLDKLI
jgi:hypothetical protein